MSNQETDAKTVRYGELPSVIKRMDRFWADHAAADSAGEPPVQGRAPEPGCVVLSGNDYLSLATDRRIVQAQIDALAGAASEVMMSAVFLGEGSAHRRFERDLARFLDAEDTVLCQSGFAANDGLVQVLSDARTPVYLDKFAHVSLWQGAQSAGAPVRPFEHNDLDHLRREMAQHGPGVVAVDAVYSTLGDLCPLAELVPLCEAHGCMLVVDESHSIGVFGERGEGLVGMLGLTRRVPYRTFSLSKAFVGRGGVIAGPRHVLDFLRYEARPAVFSSAVLDHDVARFAAALRVIEGACDRRARLHASAARLRRGLVALGYDVSFSRTPILPLIAGPLRRTVALRRALERRDVIGALFCQPATPRMGTLVRLTLSSGTTDEELERVLAVCAEIRGELCPEEWPRLRSVSAGG